MGLPTRFRKAAVALLCVLVHASLACGCGGEETPTPEPTLPRWELGYELYSWYGGPDWCFALVAGTSHVKRYEEISARDVRIEGVQALEEVLSRLPAGERVYWSVQRIPGTTLPPARTVEELFAFCNDIGVWLEIID